MHYKLIKKIIKIKTIYNKVNLIYSQCVYDTKGVSLLLVCVLKASAYYISLYARGNCSWRTRIDIWVRYVENYIVY